MGSDSPVGKARFGDQKVAGFGFDTRTGNASLRPWDRHVAKMEFF